MMAKKSRDLAQIFADAGRDAGAAIGDVLPVLHGWLDEGRFGDVLVAARSNFKSWANVQEKPDDVGFPLLGDRELFDFIACQKVMHNITELAVPEIFGSAKAKDMSAFVERGWNDLKSCGDDVKDLLESVEKEISSVEARLQVDLIGGLFDAVVAGGLVGFAGGSEGESLL